MDPELEAAKRNMKSSITLIGIANEAALELATNARDIHGAIDRAFVAASALSKEIMEKVNGDNAISKQAAIIQNLSEEFLGELEMARALLTVAQEAMGNHNYVVKVAKMATNKAFVTIAAAHLAMEASPPSLHKESMKQEINQKILFSLDNVQAKAKSAIWETYNATILLLQSATEAAGITRKLSGDVAFSTINGFEKYDDAASAITSLARHNTPTCHVLMYVKRIANDMMRQVVIGEVCLVGAARTAAALARAAVDTTLVALCAAAADTANQDAYNIAEDAYEAACAAAYEAEREATTAANLAPASAAIDIGEASTAVNNALLAFEAAKRAYQQDQETYANAIATANALHDNPDVDAAAKHAAANYANAAADAAENSTTAFKLDMATMEAAEACLNIIEFGPAEVPVTSIADALPMNVSRRGRNLYGIHSAQGFTNYWNSIEQKILSKGFNADNTNIRNAKGLVDQAIKLLGLVSTIAENAQWIADYVYKNRDIVG
ncbi:uncharacterized protein LOC107404113 [Ziziphus jujuba]|nr:uncharacterized protein LOC107404113 [Ziziphus jujuba]